MSKQKQIETIIDNWLMTNKVLGLSVIMES